MVNRIQILRSSVAGNRPAPNTRLPGEMFTNFPDKQFGVIDSTQTPQDLLAVRNFSTTTTYAIGDYVLQGGYLYRAIAAVPAGAFTAAQWAQAASLSDTTAYIAADAVVTTNFQAADTAITTAYQAADTALAANIHYRNIIGNGDFSIDQRTNGVGVTLSGYAMDRWYYYDNTASASKGTCGINTTAVPASLPLGVSPYCLQFTVSRAYTSAAADVINVSAYPTYYDFAPALFGTAKAQPLTLMFWAVSSRTGIFAGSLSNPLGTRSYVFTYTIAAANVLQQFRINIPGDTTGTWTAANNDSSSYGAMLFFNYGSGTAYQRAAGTWAAGNFQSATGSVNICATNAAWLAITNVGLMLGAAAATAQPMFKSYADNLLDCCRYFQSWACGVTPNLSNGYPLGALPVQMRTTPTISGVEISTGSGAQFTPWGNIAVYQSVANSSQAVANGNADADF